VRLGMGQPLKRPALAVMLPIILIGLAGTAIAVNDRSGDSLFTYRQQNLSAIQPASLAHLVALAPNPRPGLDRPRAIRATCTSAGTGELRNPWSCLVHYARGGTVRYGVTIMPTGRVVAVDPTGQLIIRGCCVGPRASEQ
jgi:hypothetical protein